MSSPPPHVQSNDTDASTAVVPTVQVKMATGKQGWKLGPQQGGKSAKKRAVEQEVLEEDANESQGGREAGGSGSLKVTLRWNLKK
jgi:hypothetical protein